MSVLINSQLLSDLKRFLSNVNIHSDIRDGAIINDAFLLGSMLIKLDEIDVAAVQQQNTALTTQCSLDQEELINTKLELEALQQQVKDLQAEKLNPAIVETCKVCSGHGMIGGMTIEGGEGWVCEDCDGTGVSINPVYKAEIKAAAIREMAEKKYREDSVAFRLAIEYANTLSSKGGD